MPNVIYSSEAVNIQAAGESAKLPWRTPAIDETDVAQGTGFACSPCPDSGCATARQS
jgi:hypothetical protein